MRILLVEDEEVPARLLASALEESDARLQPQRAKTLREAIELATNDGFDAVLLDLNLPDSCSLATLKRLRSTAHVPIIVFTGESGLGEEAIRAGADEYLIKGQAPATAVARALTYAVERWRSRREREERTALLEAEIAYRIRVEEELRRSEARLRTIVHSEPECVKTIAPDLQVVDMNPSGLGMLEVSDVREIVGRSILDYIHSDDRAAYRALHERVTRGESGTLEFRIIGEEGTERWVETHSVPLFEDGKVASVLSVTRDITDRRRAEEAAERTRALLQIASRVGRVGAWVVDLPDQSVTWSEETKAIYEVPPDFTPTGLNTLDFVAPGYENVIVEAYRGAARHATPFDIELQIVTARGRHRWVRVIGEALRGADGEVRSVRGATQDITERRNFEQRLLQAQRIESIGYLASGIAHDLNNLLMPILAGANLMKRADPASNERAISMIEQSARRGGELVNRILSFARGADGERAPVDLGEVVREVETIVRATLPPDIACAVQIAPDLHPITGDATQMHQLLLNLCVNARDAMPEGGRITVSAANVRLGQHYSMLNREVPAGPYVRLEVTDTGAGIAAEIRERIFDPFFTTKRPGEGTGLGLATVAAIVRGHGGTISVQSEPGRGSTFEIHLPARTDRDPSSRGEAGSTSA